MLKSTLSWVDFSEHDRDHMLQVIRMFAEPETVDELGIGSVRDALADVLFPGTSTIQTRAAYFLFIPWIYVSLEGRRASARDVAELARRREVQLRSEEHTSELQSRENLVCRLLLEKK